MKTTISYYDAKPDELPGFRVEYEDKTGIRARHFPHTRGNPSMEERARARAEGFADGLKLGYEIGAAQ